MLPQNGLYLLPESTWRALDGPIHDELYARWCMQKHIGFNWTFVRLVTTLIPYYGQVGATFIPQEIVLMFSEIYFRIIWLNFYQKLGTKFLPILCWKLFPNSLINENYKLSNGKLKASSSKNTFLDWKWNVKSLVSSHCVHSILFTPACPSGIYLTILKQFEFFKYQGSL